MVSGSSLSSGGLSATGPAPPHSGPGGKMSSLCCGHDLSHLNHSALNLSSWRRWAGESPGVWREGACIWAHRGSEAHRNATCDQKKALLSHPQHPLPPVPPTWLLSEPLTMGEHSPKADCARMGRLPGQVVRTWRPEVGDELGRQAGSRGHAHTVLP